MIYHRPSIDWSNRHEVVAYAIRLAKENKTQNTVFKRRDSDNIYICPTEMEEQYLRLPCVDMLHRTEDFHERKRKKVSASKKPIQPSHAATAAQLSHERHGHLRTAFGAR